MNTGVFQVSRSQIDKSGRKVRCEIGDLLKLRNRLCQLPGLFSSQTRLGMLNYLGRDCFDS